MRPLFEILCILALAACVAACCVLARRGAIGPTCPGSGHQRPAVAYIPALWEIQSALAAQGYDLRPDGRWGPRTEAAWDDYTNRQLDARLADLQKDYYETD